MEFLEFETTLDGIIICAKNARKLAEDASRLFKLKRYSTAGFLGISAIEEAGKTFILVIISSYMITADAPEIDWKIFWKAWRDHNKKHQAGSFVDLILFERDAMDLASHALKKQDLMTIRNNCLYIDYINGKWISPEDVNKEIISEVLDAADAITLEMLREFNPKRRHIIKKDILESMNNPHHLREVVKKFDRISKLMEKEGFSEE